MPPRVGPAHSSLHSGMNVGLSPDSYTHEKVSRYAKKVSEHMTSNSRIVNPNQERTIPAFEKDELFLGDILGSGGFNDVYSLKDIQLTRDANKDRAYSLVQREGRVELAKRAGSGKRYAVKFLSQRTMSNVDAYKNGAADLLMEAKYLGSMTNYPHPNIIRLHGVMAAAGGNEFTPGYFLIVDRLSDTLDKKMLVWRELEKRKIKQLREDPNTAKPLLEALTLKRLQTALELSSALKHLHKMKIIFRDLKPENIGFDIEGKVKLFDFGLAKELDPQQRTDNGMYTMSGGTGSRRYMAPEVSLRKPYNLSADVYSFSLVLWELLALQRVFANMTLEDLNNRVIDKGERPQILGRWPDEVQDLLIQAWADDPFRRPSMKRIHRMLERVVNLVQHELHNTVKLAASGKLMMGRRRASM